MSANIVVSLLTAIREYIGLLSDLVILKILINIEADVKDRNNRILAILNQHKWQLDSSYIVLALTYVNLVYRRPFKVRRTYYLKIFKL